MTILLADDERMVRLGMRQMIEEILSEEHTIIEAKNGEELIIAVEEKRPDIAFVDIKMPLLDGLSAIEKCSEQNYITKWVLLTGFAEFDYAKRAITCGVCDYLVKPVSVSELKNVFNKLSAELDTTQMYRQDTISQVQKYINENYMNDIGIASIAELFELTPNYLSKIFHNKTGQKFIDYLTAIRVQNAKAMFLQNCNANVSEVARKVGYYSTRHFTRTFLKLTGQLPSEYRNINKNSTK